MSDTLLSVQDVAKMIRASMSEMEGSTYERRDGEPVDSLLNCDSFAEEEARREQVCLVLFGFILTLFDYVHARVVKPGNPRDLHDPLPHGFSDHHHPPRPAR